MKKTLLTISSIFIIFFAFTQTISFNTGSVEFDADLNRINKTANSDLTVFKTDLNKTHNIGIRKIDDLLREKMQPAEIFLALKIMDISRRPLDDVLRSYRTNKNKGWGHIAKDLGIKPGSPEFHALKGKGKSNGKGNSGHGNSGKGKSSNGKGKGKK